MVVLSVAIPFLADADPARTAKDAIDFRDDPLGLFQETLVAEFLAKRHQQDHAKRIGPQISQPVGPDSFAAHPVKPGQNVVDIG